MHHYLEEWEAAVDLLAVPTTRLCSTCVVDGELWRRVDADTTRARPAARKTGVVRLHA